MEDGIIGIFFSRVFLFPYFFSSYFADIARVCVTPIRTFGTFRISHEEAQQISPMFSKMRRYIDNLVLHLLQLSPFTTYV